MPESEPTVATAALLLLHIPPVGASLNVVVEPSHTLVIPVMDDGSGLTVTSVVVRHPVDSI